MHASLLYCTNDLLLFLTAKSRPTFFLHLQSEATSVLLGTMNQHVSQAPAVLAYLTSALMFPHTNFYTPANSIQMALSMLQCFCTTITHCFSTLLHSVFGMGRCCSFHSWLSLTTDKLQYLDQANWQLAGRHQQLATGNSFPDVPGVVG